MAWLRAATGVVLFTFLVTHFLNHALGLHSLAAQEAGRAWFLLLWRNPLGTLLLYGSLVIHWILALRSLYRRRHFRLPRWEALQLLFGLAMPPLLVPHLVGTRLAWTLFGTSDTYARVVSVFWMFDPAAGVRQIALVAIAWTHGCMGLHFWLRLRPWYPRAARTFLVAAVLLPALAVLGFAEAGKEAARRAREPGWLDVMVRGPDTRSPADRELQERVRERLLAAVGGSLALVLLAGAARRLRAWRGGVVRIAYPEGRRAVVPVGFTVLEASRRAGIPHASVCGGRGRCSTCRVRVGEGAELLPPASAAEIRVLTRVGAAPGVRLACQLRPTGDLSVVPLLPAGVGPAAALGSAAPGAGREQEIVVLFADLRGFTRIAERRLPYDVVFLLNQYFAAVGGAIKRSGGVANQFAGDGVMALFGVDSGPEDGARRALAAAREIVLSVRALSATLAEELRAPLRIGIGVHVGPAVVGRMGFEETEYLTAVGDTVHVASRLEQLTKDYAGELVVSEEVARRAGLDVSALPRHEVTVRNRREPLAIRVVADAGALALPARRGGEPER